MTDDQFIIALVTLVSPNGRVDSCYVDEVKPCACFENSYARECYELRYYGYSPVLRDASGHSEGAFMVVDPDGECDCPCHFGEEDDDSAIKLGLIP